MKNLITIKAATILFFGGSLMPNNCLETYNRNDYDIRFENTHLEGNCFHMPISNITSANTSNEITAILPVIINNEGKDVLKNFIHTILDECKPIDAVFSNFISENFWDLI